MIQSGYFRFSKSGFLQMRFSKPALIAAILFAQFAFAQNSTRAFWDWSPAAPHHAAAVQIECNGYNASGVYVEHNGQPGVLTCAHLFDQKINGRKILRPPGTKVRVTFRDGQTLVAILKSANHGFDLAWIHVSHRTTKPLRIARAAPPIGSRVEFVAFGTGVFRHWFAKLNRQLNARFSKFTSYVMHGDSGGAILNTNNEVVSIQSSGENAPAGEFKDKKGTVWPILPNPTGASQATVFQFCQDVCQPSFRPFVQPQFNQPRIQQPPAQAPPKSVEIEIDYNKVADLIFARMKTEADIFKGPDGKDGQPGLRGIDGQNGKDGKAASIDYDKLAAEVIKRMPPIRVIREGANGSQYAVDEIKPGDELRLPPIRWEIQHPDNADGSPGKMAYQERAIGQVVAIKLVPKK